jgi:hypothetical protein
MPSASNATTTPNSRQRAVIEQLGNELAKKLDRLFLWARESVNERTPAAARNHYNTLCVSACTELWTAAGRVTPPEDVPREHRLLVGLARQRIAYAVWNAAAIVGERDYTLGCQIQQCGAVWLDSAAELSKLVRGEA